MEPIAPGQTVFIIHGPDPTGDEPVSGAIFARKLGTLIRALKAADRQANNGNLVHDYKIASLHSSSPTVTLAETPIPKFEGLVPLMSGIPSFEDCADAIVAGDRDRALRYGNCAKYIGALAGGAEKTYGYAEVWTSETHITRVDTFLGEQSQSIVHPEIVRRSKEDDGWYKGIVEASFDGAIKAVDLRGQLPEIKLILTAGGKQLDCVCRGDHLDVIGNNLNSRVRVYGSAIYDGRSGLPRRIMAREIEPISGHVDFTKWRGAFEPFEPLDWDANDA